MIGIETVSEVLKSAILSAKVERTDIQPVSLFLVAPPERGKTTVAIASTGKHGLILSDISGIGLLEALQQSPTATHVIINDLTSVSGHKQQVKTLTISVLNALAEEGSYKIALPRMSHLDMKGRKVGVIACCIPEMFHDNRNWWQKSGFASRLLVLQYDHSPDLTLRILRSIATNDGKPKAKEKVLIKPFAIPQASVYVSIPQRFAERILNITQFIARDRDELGYRKEKQLRGLACGHALLRTWKQPQVQEQEIDFLEKILPFIVVQNNRVVELK